MTEFQPFPKIPRLRRSIVITEKIDGTNACIVISDDGTEISAQSRNRIITPEQDNAGFAQWVYDNHLDLMASLGPGYHFGEWWGVGIGRGYSLRERRFSLFNTKRWAGVDIADGVDTVPIIASGPMSDETIKFALEQLHLYGSVAAPGYMKPEGIVVFHTQSQQMFKVLLENDEMAKSAVDG